MKPGSGTLPRWLESAVLIYGPRKAGTTLLLNLHDGSDELVVYPTELKLKFLFNSQWGGRPSHAVRVYYNQSLVIGHNFPHFDSDGFSEYVESLKSVRIGSLRELIQRDILGVYQNICVSSRPNNPRSWVVKEVGGQTREIIDLWRQTFFSTKLVMIVRDPLMITRSVLQDRRRKGIRLSARQIYMQVHEPIRVMTRQLSFADDPDVVFISYEELTRDPGAAMQEVSRFLEVDYVQSFEWPTIFGRRVVTTTSSRRTKAVFSQECCWHDGLSLREALYVRLFSEYLKVRRIQLGREPFRYSDLLDRVNRNKGRCS